MKATMTISKGGPGSGHRGHRGRPGKRGGGLPGTGYSFKPGTSDESNRWKAQDTRANTFINKGIGYFETATPEQRADLKDEIVTNISKGSGVEYETVNEMTSQWARSSNDSDMRSLSLQQAASEEFGVELSEWQQNSIDDRLGTREKFVQLVGEENLPLRLNSITDRATERQVLRTMYTQTQEQLRAAGFQPDDTITLFRGFDRDTVIKNRELTSYKGNAMESWSALRIIARSFGNTLITMDVPVKNIIGTCKTGFGCLKEAEFVIVGSLPGQEVFVLDV